VLVEGLIKRDMYFYGMVMSFVTCHLDATGRENASGAARFMFTLLCQPKRDLLQWTKL
jgi:hypothetical protein